MSTAKKRGLILLIACFVAALLFAVANKYYNIQPIELNIQIKSDGSVIINATSIKFETDEPDKQDGIYARFAPDPEDSEIS